MSTNTNPPSLLASPSPARQRNFVEYVKDRMESIPAKWLIMHLVVNTRYIRPSIMSGVHVVALDEWGNLTSAPLGLFEGTAEQIAEALEVGLGLQLVDRTREVGCLIPAIEEDEEVDLRRLPLLPIEFKELDRLPDGCEAILLSL